MNHGPIRRPQHSFARDWEAADADLARMLANRRKRNEACAAERHVPGTCDACKRDREDAQRGALAMRFGQARRDADALLSGRVTVAQLEARDAPAPVEPSPLTVALAIAVWLANRT